MDRQGNSVTPLIPILYFARIQILQYSDVYNISADLQTFLCKEVRRWKSNTTKMLAWKIILIKSCGYNHSFGFCQFITSIVHLLCYKLEWCPCWEVRVWHPLPIHWCVKGHWYNCNWKWIGWQSTVLCSQGLGELMHSCFCHSIPNHTWS